MEVEVRVEGGSSEQGVDAIYFALLTRYETEDHIRTGVIDKFHVADPFTIGPDEERTFPITIDVPLDTPITVGRTDVWLETGLGIDERWSQLSFTDESAGEMESKLRSEIERNV